MDLNSTQVREKQSQNILGLIPARSGSKGIPKKNVRTFSGKPLIAWTIEAALKSCNLTSIIVSTDDEEIASVAQSWGAEVPFLRPAELSRDSTPGIDPVLHALSKLSKIDAVMLLQPTSPLRTTEDIDECIERFWDLSAKSIVSVTKPNHHPSWMYQLNSEHQLIKVEDICVKARRQDLPDVYALNGALYCAQAGWLRHTQTFLTQDTYAYVMPENRSVDIDTELDWQIAELLMRERM